MTEHAWYALKILCVLWVFLMGALWGALYQPSTRRLMPVVIWLFVIIALCGAALTAWPRIIKHL